MSPHRVPRMLCVRIIPYIPPPTVQGTGTDHFQSTSRRRARRGADSPVRVLGDEKHIATIRLDYLAGPRKVFQNTSMLSSAHWVSTHENSSGPSHSRSTKP